MEGHRVILNDFLDFVKNDSITSILDAGSGRTSLSIITDSFSSTPIDAVVYPGDLRKISSIKEIADHNNNVRVIEKDICSDAVIREYDLSIVYKSYFTNLEPQVWEDFTGVHNFGYLIKRL